MSERIKPDAPELDKQTLLELHRKESKFRQLTKEDLCYVRFCIRSEEHTSSDLTDMFEIEPQDLMDDGEVVIENNRYLIHNTGGFWVLNSKDEVESTQIEDHLHWLLDQLYDKRDLISKLQSQGAEVGLKIHAEPKSGVVSCEIDSQMIKRFAQMNLDISFNVICRGAIC